MLIQQLSVYGVLVPIFVGFMYFRNADLKYRVLIYMLVYAFLSDFIITSSLPHGIPYLIYVLYALVEPAFFCWFIWKTNINSTINKIAKILLIVFPLYWIVVYYKIFYFDQAYYKFDPYYAPTNNLIISLLYGYGLLKLSEQRKQLNSDPLFWFMLALFFNYFCMFFISNFLATAFNKKVWFVPCLINLVVYVFFTIAFYKMGKGQNFSETTSDSDYKSE